MSTTPGANNAPGTSRMILFTDLRYIHCNDLTWQSRDGTPLPVAGPPGPPVQARAALGWVPRGVRLQAQPATKTEPIPGGGIPGRITYDHGVYRSWSLAVDYPPDHRLGAYATEPARSVTVCYSESGDGYEWTQKHRCPIQVPAQTGFDGVTFFIDEHGPPAERYKLVYNAIAPEHDAPLLMEQYKKLHPRYQDYRLLTSGVVRAIYAAVSSDGLDWKPVAQPLMMHYSDTDTTVTYNTYLCKYLMYTRLFNYGRREIAIAEADDFYDWGLVQPLIWEGMDALSSDIYTNAYTQYPGVPDSHLMFPMIYHRYTQQSEVRMYSSPNGLQWYQVPGSPVLTPGQSDQWDCEYIIAGKTMVPLGSDKVAIPYSGTRYPHKYPRWKEVLESHGSVWAWWPKGRICAVVADEEGEFWAFGRWLPVVPAGRQLRLNVRTCRAGEVRVGVEGVDGRSVDDCEPIIGDHFAAPVHWNGQTDIGTPQGQPVTLHFKLRAAELFGLEWV